MDRLRIQLVGHSVLSRIPVRTGLKVLDLGCGFHAQYLRSIGRRLAEGVGVDFNVSDESRRDPKLRFLLMSIETALVNLPDSEFDVILFISVLEHLANPQECLQHCHRVMKKDGVLLINVPTWWAKPVLELSAFRFGTSPACEMDDHKMYYSKRDLWPLLVRAGFKPSQIRLSYQFLGMTLFSVARK
ncbi:MAG TPA: methyltransferase domain-containing protein [Terriglobales bacterium]|nr:methyltransferase domain-containing protein [Terriglobales bacterium]